MSASRISPVVAAAISMKPPRLRTERQVGMLRVLKEEVPGFAAIRRKRFTATLGAYSEDSEWLFWNPMPRHQLVDALLGDRSRGASKIDDIDLRIDAIELAGLDQRCPADQFSPPSSLPANRLLLPHRAITRSFCPCRAGAGSPLPVAPLFPAEGSCSARGAKSNRAVCAGGGTDRHRHLHRRLDVRSRRVCEDGSGRAVR